MTSFPQRLERLFRPVDDWGQFRRGARRAAVVLVLYEKTGTWHVPFVRRRADLPDHPGQVALPGGGVRDGETGWRAAEREVEEEIGVPAGRLVPLGAGDPIYTSVSNFSVVPFVAHLPNPVPPFEHDRRELDGVLEIPLDRLLDAEAWATSDAPWNFRFLTHDQSMVWGLTERIVAGLTPQLLAALRSD